jgi:hypothetical protein
VTASLDALGLREGEEIRFRRPDRKRWQTGFVRRLGADGSIGVTDANGASRSVAPALVEVRRIGPRGKPAWEPLLDRAGRTQQLELGTEPPPEKRRRS